MKNHETLKNTALCYNQWRVQSHMQIRKWIRRCVTFIAIWKFPKGRGQSSVSLS